MPCESDAGSSRDLREHRYPYRRFSPSPSLAHSSKFRIPQVPTLRPHKSLSCNTYGPPRKRCNQKTYGQAKPFRCNTYNKHGGWGCPLDSISIFSIRSLGSFLPTRIPFPFKHLQNANFATPLFLWSFTNDGGYTLTSSLLTL